jgi:hypothetical protein
LQFVQEIIGGTGFAGDAQLLADFGFVLFDKGRVPWRSGDPRRKRSGEGAALRIKEVRDELAL